MCSKVGRRWWKREEGADAGCLVTPTDPCSPRRGQTVYWAPGPPLLRAARDTLSRGRPTPVSPRPPHGTGAGLGAGASPELRKGGDGKPRVEPDAGGRPARRRVAPAGAALRGCRGLGASSPHSLECGREPGARAARRGLSLCPLGRPRGSLGPDALALEGDRPRWVRPTHRASRHLHHPFSSRPQCVPSGSWGRASDVRTRGPAQPVTSGGHGVAPRARGLHLPWVLESHGV